MDEMCSRPHALYLMQPFRLISFLAYFLVCFIRTDRIVPSVGKSRGKPIYLRCPKISRTSVHKRRKMGSSYLPTLRKCCVLLLYLSSQMEITEQNSTKLCDMLGSELDLQTHFKNWSPQKLGS